MLFSLMSVWTHGREQGDEKLNRPLINNS